MIRLEKLLQRELKSTMLFMSGGLALILSVFLAASLWWTARNEVLLVENFVSEATQNALVFAQPIVLQRSAAEFWRAFATQESLVAGFDIYLDNQWVAQVGSPAPLSVRFTKVLKPISGKTVQIAMTVSLIPFLVRWLIAEMLLMSFAVLIYKIRLRWTRNEIRRLAEPIDREISHKTKELGRLQRQQEVADAQRLLAAQVAHDIRSPLSFLNILLKRPQFIEENLEDVGKAVNRLNEIAGDLLKNPVLTATTFNIRPLVDEVVAEKSGSGNQIQVDFSPEDLSICASSAEFKRVLSNLLNNSLEACDQSAGSLVTLRARKGEAGTTELTIIDNGRGMSAEALAQVGRLGFTQSKNGHGLGLHHAFKMVESWNGQLKVTSRENVGTQVTLLLPST